MPSPPCHRPTGRWILAHHDLWSRATLSPLFVSLAHGALTPDLFARWLLDRASIARVIVHACERVYRMLAARNIDFPALELAREEADYLEAYATKHGLDVESRFRLSYDAGRLVELIESATGARGEDISICMALAVTWGFMCCSFQGCSLSRRNQAISQSGPHPTHSELRHFLSRDDSMVRVVETQGVLDALLETTKEPGEFEKAQKTFAELLLRRVATLDSALESGQKDGRAPLCQKCGRKGHVGERCTFKSHV